jgi:hypothetical protein
MRALGVSETGGRGGGILPAGDLLPVVFVADDGGELQLEATDVLARSREELWRRGGIGGAKRQRADKDQR